jgi:hypothetical protein
VKLKQEEKSGKYYVGDSKEILQLNEFKKQSEAEYRVGMAVGEIREIPLRIGCISGLSVALYGPHPLLPPSAGVWRALLASA